MLTLKGTGLLLGSSMVLRYYSFFDAPKSIQYTTGQAHQVVKLRHAW